MGGIFWFLKSGQKEMCAARATFRDADQGFGFVKRSNWHLRLTVVAASPCSSVHPDDESRTPRTNEVGTEY